MDLNTFLENFDTIAQAPNGIAKLRSLILDLAVQGKLTPQDPEDEPAIESLERMQREKAEVIQTEGFRAKNKKNLFQDNEYEINFLLPNKWTLAELDDLCIFIDYRGQTPPKVKSGIRLITAKNVRDGFIKNDPEEFITEEIYHAWMTRGFPRLGDVLFTTEAPLGKAAVVNIVERFALAQRIINLRPLSGVYGYFLMWLILSPWFQNELQNRATGMTATGIKAAKLKLIRIPLPPLAEQKRIVEKVDELMALCDRLQASQESQNNLRQKLKGSAIASLMNAETDEELQKSWAIVRDNWQTLSQKPEDVEGLRKTVLQLAAMGKLVSQVPVDESANQLLQKAIQEKALMFQAGLISKPKQPLPILEDKCPFSLPSSWRWVRLEDVCSYIVDCLHRTPKYQNEGYPAIRTSDMRPGEILFDQARKVGREEYEMQTQRLVPKAGDIFYSREGNFGIAAVVPEGVEMCLSQRMMQFRVVSEVNPHFFSWIMNSSVMYEQAARDVVGMTVPHVNIRSLKEFIFPLAPYAEQKRIVAKVDELMQMCDKLEESLRQSQQQAEALAASAISHLTL